MSLSKHIEELCHEVSKEKDGEKLLSLVDQLNKELEHISESPAGDQSGRRANSKSAKPNITKAA